MHKQLFWRVVSPTCVSTTSFSISQMVHVVSMLDVPKRFGSCEQWKMSVSERELPRRKRMWT